MDAIDTKPKWIPWALSLAAVLWITAMASFACVILVDSNHAVVESNHLTIQSNGLVLDAMIRVAEANEEGNQILTAMDRRMRAEPTIRPKFGR